MDLVKKYMMKHRQYMLGLFNSMGKSNKIQATKVFTYFQNSFNQEQFRFEFNGRNFFQDDENSTQMEKLLESYYRITQGDQSKKFYLYRIQYSFQDITQIIQFWLQRQPNMKVVYIEDGGDVAHGSAQINQHSNKQQKQQQENSMKHIRNDVMLNQENNEFDVDQNQITALIQQQQLKIKQFQNKLRQSNTPQQITQINRKIQEIKVKIKVLEQQLKTNSPKNQKKINRIRGRVNSMEQSANTVDSPKSTIKKITINYKAIFDFYAKQTHLTGVKATFQRIQHQSQSINYQKLVHFLRQFGFLPTSVSDRKKVHAFYIKNCQTTRTLNLQGFMNVLDSVADLLNPGKTKQQRADILKQKIYEKDTKNNKILSHPFHSLQKQDFRINVNQLNYNFKLKPQDGKFVHEVNNSIQKRRKDKSEAKQDRLKQRQQKQFRYLKKLQSIDPFNPLLIKNKQLFQPKTQQYEPIASLENMEKYRDNSFNFEDQFGIDLKTSIMNNQVPERKLSGLKRQNSERYKKGEDTQKKIDKLQRYQQQKMSNLMSGIIQRNNAKMQKLGISPNKLEKSVRFT